jgi:hypothetical protein
MMAGLLLAGLGGIFSGAAGGQAKDRANENDFTTSRNNQRTNIYGTQQGALLDSILAGGKDKMSGYGTQQGATTDALQGLQGATTAAKAGESNEKIALAKLGMDAPTANAKASILGSLMKNMQRSNFVSPAGQQGHLTKFSGGMTADNLDPLTREHGDELMQAALEKQLSGGGLPGATDFGGGVQDWSKAVLDVPEATDYSKGLMLPPELTGDYKKAGKLETILSALGGGLSGAGAVQASRGRSGNGTYYEPGDENGWG